MACLSVVDLRDDLLDVMVAANTVQVNDSHEGLVAGGERTRHVGNKHVIKCLYGRRKLKTSDKGHCLSLEVSNLNIA